MAKPASPDSSSPGLRLGALAGLEAEVGTIHKFNPKRRSSARAKSTPGTNEAVSAALFAAFQKKMSQDAIEQSQAEKWAYGLMGGFLLLMFVTALTVWIDRQNRSSLEKITAPTAVGDLITLKFDPRENPGREVLRWKGQPYFLQTNEPLNFSEFNARKIGSDDAGKIELYQVKKQNDVRVVLVKIAANKFLRLTPR